MLASLLRRIVGRRSGRGSGDPAQVPRGAGWDRLHDDPTFEFTRRMAESPGGQPPTVHRRRR